MFFAIAALVVSAIEIAVGVSIGLSVAKYRRGNSVGAESPAASRTLFAENREPRPSGPPFAFDAVAAPPTTDTSFEPAEPRESVSAPRAADDGARRPGQPRPVAEVATSVALLSGPERRTSARRSFAFRQQVAPYHGGSLPGRASFREVECQDISSTGFSFLSTQLPDFDSLVVALGVPPRLTYLQAQIVNRFPIADSAAPLYRIGCRFAGQVMPW